MESRLSEKFARRLRFSYLSELLRMVFPRGTSLEGRLEFSVEISGDRPIPFRFGLFKVYDQKMILALCERTGSRADFSGVMDIMGDFPQEYAFGFDEHSGPKIYFLRLQDDVQFHDRILPAVERLAQYLDIRPVENAALEKCYLIGVGGTSRLKLYLRDTDVKFDSIPACFRHHFTSVFSQDDFKDTTISQGYSGSQHASIAVFFETKDGNEQKVYDVVKRATGRHEEYDALLNLFDGSLTLGHVGVSVSEKKEALRIYLSPKEVLA